MGGGGTDRAYPDERAVCGLQRTEFGFIIHAVTDIIERLRSDLANATTAQIKALAVDMGVPPGTLIKVVNEQTKSPRYETVKAIQAYYDRLPVAPMALPQINDHAAGA